MGKPIVPWMGSKRRLVKHIVPLIPEHKTYVEPFAGAGAVLFNKQESKVEVLNDANGELVNLYRVVKHHLDEFVRQFRWALISRQAFLWERDTPPDVLTDIQRAARFYYLQRTCFGAKAASPTFGTAAKAPPSMNLLRLEEELSAVHLRLARVYIEHLDWAACVAKYDRPETVFYADPPYYGTSGYGVPFALDEYRKLADLARSIQGKMLISINDCQRMRETFKGLVKRRLRLDYTVGGTGRGKGRHELLIRNW